VPQHRMWHVRLLQARDLLLADRQLLGGERVLLAILCERRCAFEHAMAEASDWAPKDWTSRQQRLSAEHRGRGPAIRSQVDRG